MKAFNERPNYYSATVYLSKSNACILVSIRAIASPAPPDLTFQILTNLALVCIISFIYGLQRLLYGSLRTIEIEQLSEKAWYAVLDTLFAMPSLRDDISVWLLLAFVLLLAGKIWAWIAEGRVDILEQQPPANPRTFHVRLSASLLVSIAFDVFMCRYCFRAVLNDPRPSMMVIFAFEYAILTTFSVFTAGRYSLALYEAHVVSQQTRQKLQERKAEIKEERRRVLREAGQNEADAVEPTDDDVNENEIDVPGWEEKRRWLFGLELATDAVKIVTYTIFFTISLTFIGFPMHAIRDAYLTVAAFTKRIQDYANYRRATDDMNSRYPDATTEELSNDNTCIVCREVMTPWDSTAPPQGANQPATRAVNEGLRAKKLPCGHILHLRCLKAWLERQQSCPTCRRPVIARNAPQTGAAEGQPAPGANNPGVAGNNAQAGAQQPPQQRRNRMRWLNMGPIRVGFYNGAGRHMQQALAQGLAGGENAQAQNASSIMPAQEHLRMAELRLLHDAHNLEVDRAQMVTGRALEAELARLRALRTTNNAAVAAGSENSTQTQQPVAAPGASSTQPVQQQPAQIISNATHAVPPPPRAAQQYQLAVNPGTGNANLPAGMTLPAGWSITPLQRIGRVLQPPANGSFGVTTVTHHTPGPTQSDPRPASAPPERNAPAPPEPAPLADTGSEPTLQSNVPDTAVPSNEHSITPAPTWSFPPPTSTANEIGATIGPNEIKSSSLPGYPAENQTGSEAEGSAGRRREHQVEIEDATDDGNA